MSVVVGIEHELGCVLAWDSCYSDDDSETIADGKGFVTAGGLVCASVGSARTAQVVQYHLGLKPPQAGADVQQWGVTRLVPALGAMYEKHLESWVEKAKDPDRGIDAIFVVNNQVWSLDTDWHWGRSSRGYAATGSGGHGALCALAATVGLDPGPRAEIVVRAVSRHTAGVSPPVGGLWIPNSALFGKTKTFSLAEIL